MRVIPRLEEPEELWSLLAPLFDNIVQRLLTHSVDRVVLTLGQVCSAWWHPNIARIRLDTLSRLAEIVLHVCQRCLPSRVVISYLFVLNSHTLTKVRLKYSNPSRIRRDLSNCRPCKCEQRKGCRKQG
jgi:hypothetical protein